MSEFFSVDDSPDEMRAKLDDFSSVVVEHCIQMAIMRIIAKDEPEKFPLIELLELIHKGEHADLDELVQEFEEQTGEKYWPDSQEEERTIESFFSLN